MTLALAKPRTPIPSWKLTLQDDVETRPLSAGKTRARVQFEGRRLLTKGSLCEPLSFRAPPAEVTLSATCVFRATPATDSVCSQPPIPAEPARVSGTTKAATLDPF